MARKSRNRSKNKRKSSRRKKSGRKNKYHKGGQNYQLEELGEGTIYGHRVNIFFVNRPENENPDMNLIDNFGQSNSSPDKFTAIIFKYTPRQINLSIFNVKLWAKTRFVSTRLASGENYSDINLGTMTNLLEEVLSPNDFYIFWNGLDQIFDDEGLSLPPSPSSISTRSTDFG